MKPLPRNSTIERFFAGITEQTFQSQLGVADPDLIDYLSKVLIRFVHHDAIYRIRRLNGRPVASVGEMLAEAESRVGLARRDVHRHIGDFTLFWVGLYPESLRERRGRVHLDRFGDYVTHGKHAYRVASTIACDADEETSNELLEQLSDEFEMCAYGLREVRREWERRDDGDVPPMLIN